ncbi:hypothetical protein CU669_18410 [Paramagnetospirillum kuznetsovii]|uniref:Flagellar protein FliL n=1 Tax=Paramagnetospirillum kuznetsovii TaxID=2053833 RepID=A0A364NU73_9PROT|nr:hypothetical protein [Paramagnetospirillum kuznetsovii]RAU20427.1 hypothetical protein CU669_18410 [Paramagnetospirillum kuznetsovii]
MRRRHVVSSLAALLAVLPLGSALANSGGGEKKDEKKKDDKKPGQLPIPGKGQRYVRLPTIVLELWDKDGNFRMSSVDLLLLVREEAKLQEKNLAEKMKRQLNSIPYEEYMASNPAPMIKASMLDLARKEPGGDMILDLLINKMLFR